MPVNRYDGTAMLCPIPELLQRQRARLRLGHPAGRQIIDATLEVKAQLIIDRGDVHAAARQAQDSADSMQS